ncbi:MAG TPA: GNAT family N-acetyltransferase, partial [Alphaproteobacteria bacterium]|nr:GNAT family N-acetyltransferase [Alphaproteobacteria bacterium]
MDGDSLTLDLATSIDTVPAAEWDAVAGRANPFVSHAFLAAMEAGGATGGDSGWDPTHLVLRDAGGRLVGAMPHYLKHHSYGEYIFDHSWANAFMQAGGSYYPKMLSAVPFTPATGPRFLIGDVPAERARMLRHALADGLVQYLDQFDLSSAHINFLPESDTAALAEQGWMIRSSMQFHWQNDGYQTFDDFLAALSSRKRKNIRKERRTVADAGVRLLRLTGDDITASHIDDFYRFYMSTIDRKW